MVTSPASISMSTLKTLSAGMEYFSLKRLTSARCANEDAGKRKIKVGKTAMANLLRNIFVFSRLVMNRV